MIDEALMRKMSDVFSWVDINMKRCHCFQQAKSQRGVGKVRRCGGGFKEVDI